MIAIANSSPLLRNQPVGLTPEQVADPYIVIDNFFTGGEHLPVYRRRLKKWLIAAIDGELKWKRNKLVRCIYTYISIAQLLDALWLIKERGDLFTPEDVALRRDEEEDADVWTDDVIEQIINKRFDETDFYPEFLTQKEEQVPFKVIHNFFQIHDLFEAKEKIDLWCHSAIANHWEYRVMNRQSLIIIYEQINMLIEAVFIIVQVRLLKKDK